MELKELINDEELYLKVSAKLNGQQVIIAAKDEKYIKDDGTFVTKDKMNEVVTQRLSEVTDQKKILTDSKEILEAQLETLKSENKGNEELVQQLNNMKEEIEKKDKEIIYTTKESKLRNILATTAGAKYPELVMSKFKIDELEIEGDSIKGFDELVKPIKESYPELFGVKAPIEGDDGANGGRGEFNLSPAEKKAAKDRGLSDEDYHEILKKNKEIKETNNIMQW